MMNENKFRDIEELKGMAKIKGLSIVFRNNNTNLGDFCIFIYDKKVKSSYMIGFDGNWNGKIFNFSYCCKQAKEWIGNY